MTGTENNKITVQTFQVSEKYILFFYSGSWCKPCTNIKPYVYNNFKTKEINNYEILKSDYQKDTNKYVPFFQIKTNENDKMNLVDSIQTSNPEHLNTFLNYYNIPFSLIDNDLSEIAEGNLLTEIDEF